MTLRDRVRALLPASAAGPARAAVVACDVVAAVAVVIVAAVVAAAFAVAAPASAEPGEPVRVHGTDVRLVPPEGFVSAERFPGFQREADGATIQVTVIPAPAAEIRKSMTREALATRGVRLLASTTEKVNGAEGTLIRAGQSARGAEILKWMLVAGDEKTTVMIVGSFPADASPELDASIRAAILSATWERGTASDPFDGLPFRLETAGRLKIAGRVGGNVLLTESGKPRQQEPDEALFVAGMSHAAAGIPDLAAFSQSRVRQTAETTDVGNVRGQAVRVAGREGYEVVADAKEARSGRALVVFQVLVPDGKGYWIFQGLAPADRAAEVLPDFRKVVASVRRAGDDAPAPAPVPPPKSDPEPGPGAPRTGEPKTGEPKTGEPKTGEPPRGDGR